MSSCMICGHMSHGLRVCPELVEPLRDGFYKPQGGGGGHAHDDDDEALVLMETPQIHHLE